MSTSIPITEEQHIEIMRAMNENTVFYKRNPQVIAILITESSIGLRLGDVLSMKLNQIHTSEKGYRLKIKEKKTFDLFDCGERTIITIEKISSTPAKYPRPTAKIAKNPIR